LPFRVAARAVLELGSELISSDEIALYELVKNAFDAGSPDVSIRFHVPLPRTEFESLATLLVEPEYLNEVTGEARKPNSEERAEALLAFRHAQQALKKRFESLMPETDIGRAISDSSRRSELLAVIQAAYDDLNYIVIKDTGEGMTMVTLEGAFLTIGTANRQQQRLRERGSRSRQLLGEKGVGRLSAMRLGSKLDVETATESDKAWNTLRIDWTLFGLDPDELVSDVPVILSRGMGKPKGESGTTLTIGGLEADWTTEKLRRLAAKELSRLSDPFLSRSKTFPIKVKFNDEDVKWDRLSSDLFKAAHGYCHGSLKLVKGKPEFNADFEYRLYNETTSFKKEASELADAITTQVPRSALRTLGPFHFEFYWFNRQALKAIDSIGNTTAVRNLVNNWSGGLMVFRDNFRVNPYGAPGDDWLELNRQAFRSSGYLLNTDQIIGRLQITADENPRLVDQTNREGLRDNFEFQALKNLMHQFFTVDLKRYIGRINEEYAGLKGLDFRQVDRNVQSYEQRVVRNINQLLKLFPGQKDTLSDLQDQFQAMKHAYEQARSTVTRSEEQVQRLMDLAGVGLMVEVIAHELARATKHTLDLITTAQGQSSTPNLSRTFSSLQAQLVTIERRLRVLDPLSVSGRQRRTSFDLVEALNDVFVSREDELRRAGIVWSVEGQASVRVLAVKGGVYQIIENLLSNSMHWLGRAKEENPSLKPRIRVTLSKADGGSFTFRDNGPGIAAAAADKVFDAFFTTRGEVGKGLGLFIARAAAQQHGGDLELVDVSAIHPNRYNTFKYSTVADGDD
jgi:signal transduction histidine kinase